MVLWENMRSNVSYNLCLSSLFSSRDLILHNLPREPGSFLVWLEKLAPSTGLHDYLLSAPRCIGCISFFYFLIHVYKEMESVDVHYLTSVFVGVFSQFALVFLQVGCPKPPLPAGWVA